MVDHLSGRDGIISATDDAGQIVAQARDALTSAAMYGGRLPLSIEDGATPPPDLSNFEAPTMVVVIPFVSAAVAAWAKTGSRRALRACAGGRRGQRGRPVLQEPVLGTADGERRDRPGVLGVLLVVPEALQLTRLHRRSTAGRRYRHYVKGSKVNRQSSASR